jgi:hypothetical protein
LKELIRLHEGRSIRERLASGRLVIPRSAVTAVSGTAKTEAVVEWLRDVLRAQPDFRVAWIEDEFIVNPTALFEREIDLDRILFVEGFQDTLWSVAQVLKSGLFGAVVVRPAAGPAGAIPERELRRLQLSAEKSGSALIFLMDAANVPWPVSVWIRSDRKHDDYAVETLRSKT